MRKPRDLEAELRVLQNRSATVRARMVMRLGELVETIGAGALELDVLAGALLEAMAETEPETIERWRSRGAAFFALRREARPRNR
ncbi:conjugal transfer protein TraD [Phenylobacterium soli]|nr:conjugal transfer protein TraD [Phenylobacterium soli]